MSDIDTGYDGNDVDYGHYEAGQEHDALDQLHQEQGHEADYNNQFNVYEQDHAAAVAGSAAARVGAAAGRATNTHW